jgi:hypothetical protein
MVVPVFLTHASRSGPPLRLSNWIPFPSAILWPIEEVLRMRARTFVCRCEAVSAGNLEGLVKD